MPLRFSRPRCSHSPEGSVEKTRKLLGLFVAAVALTAVARRVGALRNSRAAKRPRRCASRTDQTCHSPRCQQRRPEHEDSYFTLSFRDGGCRAWLRAVRRVGRRGPSAERYQLFRETEQIAKQATQISNQVHVLESPVDRSLYVRMRPYICET